MYNYDINVQTKISNRFKPGSTGKIIKRVTDDPDSQFLFYIQTEAYLKLNRNVL